MSAPPGRVCLSASWDHTLNERVLTLLRSNFIVSRLGSQITFGVTLRVLRVSVDDP